MFGLVEVNTIQDALAALEGGVPAVRCHKSKTTAPHCANTPKTQVCTTRAQIHNFYTGKALPNAFAKPALVPELPPPPPLVQERAEEEHATV